VLCQQEESAAVLLYFRQYMFVYRLPVAVHSCIQIVLSGLRVKARMEVHAQCVASNKAETNCSLCSKVTFIVVVE